MKFIFILFVFCLVGAGVFYFFNTQKEEVQASLNSEEQSLVILNPHSNPEVGDNWTVSFETKSIADLTIIPQDQATIDDLGFVSLTCDGQKRNPQILENDVIFYPNWSCDGQGEITHLVKIIGKHTLKFQFGNEIAWAYNNPNFYLTDKAAITGTGSPYYLDKAVSVYVSGDYAYVAGKGNDALTVFDISDVANGNITHKAAITGVGSPNYLNDANSVYVSGDYAYVASYLDHALTVFDISDVANGNITHKAKKTGSAYYLTRANSVYVSGDYAYVTGSADDALTVFDISDVVNGWIAHITAITGAGSPNYLGDPRSVYVSGNYAYVASYADDALTVFDISDIANGNITHKAAITGAGSPYYLHYAKSVYVSGNYAYVTGYEDDALTVFDISDVANGNITHKAAITGAGSPNYLYGAQSVYVSGNYAYVTGYLDDALTVFDISDVVNGNITHKAAITGAGSPNYLYGALSVYVSGDYAYVTSYLDDALTVFYASTTPLGALINGYESHDTLVSPSSPGTDSTDYYQKVLDDDSYRWRTVLSTTNGGYDSQVFKFQPDFTGISKPKITISWNGYGDVTATESYKVYLYIWNFNSSSWEELDNAHLTSDGDLSGYKIGTNYKDASGYVWAWLKADNKYSPPTISNVDSGTPDGYSATITWDTNISADAIVAYDTASHSSGSWADYAKFDNDEDCNPCTDSLAEGGEAGNTSHSISLGSLLSETTYYYRVRSADADGDKTTSTEDSFTTAKSSCPFVYSWDGQKYVFDNEGLTKHHYLQYEGSQFTRLPSLKPKGSEFLIKITEEKPEDTYLNYVELLSLKHDQDVEVYPGWLNKLYTIKNPIKPLTATDNTGEDVSNLLEKDEIYWNYQDYSGTNVVDLDGDGLADGKTKEELLKYLELTFPKPKNANTAKLLLRITQLSQNAFVGGNARGLIEKYDLLDKMIAFNKNFLKENIGESTFQELSKENAFVLPTMFNILVWDGSEWILKGFVYDKPMEKGPNIVHPLDVSDIDTDQLKIRFIGGPNKAGLDYVWVDYSEDANVEIEKIPLKEAVKDQKSVLESLKRIDDQRLELKPGEEVKLVFEKNLIDRIIDRIIDVINKIKNIVFGESQKKTTYFINLHGYYYGYPLQDVELSKPVVEKAITTPMLLGRLLIPKYLEQLSSQGEIHIIKKGDTLWSISQVYNVSLNSLLERNQNVIEDPNSISPGTILWIPEKEKEKVSEDKGIEDYQGLPHSLNTDKISVTVEEGPADQAPTTITAAPVLPPVSATGQGNISENLGGQVSQTFESGKIAKVVFPAKTIKGTVVIKIEPKDKIEIIKTNPLPQNTQIIGDLVADFKALSGGKELESFEKEISITFTYTDSQIEEVKIDEKTIKIYWWNKSTGAWQSLKSEVNTLTNTVTAHTIHFALFAVMGETEEKPIEEVPAIAYEGIPAGFTFEKKLKYGDKNNDVKYLQTILKIETPETYPADVPATGWFGPITKASVIAFQEKYASDILTPWDLTEGTGFVGSTTRAKLNSLLAAVPIEEKEVTPEISEIPADYKFTANLQYGQTSDEVRYLQTFLKAQGTEIYPEGIVSGWFGPLTRKAVIRFQEKYASDILALWELTEGTGFVGKTTRAKINESLGR